MDRHNLTSYPLKLPFIRSSKIARRQCLFENERNAAEFGDFRCGTQGSPSSRYSNAERFTLQSKISVAPAKKAPIEIQMENFRKKAIQMGFSSDDDRSLGSYPSRSATLQTADVVDYSNNRDFMYPLSQPLPSSYAATNDAPFVWSQQVSKRPQPFAFDSYNSQHDQNSRTPWLARNEFHFSQPVENCYATKSFEPGFNVQTNLSFHNGSTINDRTRHLPFMQESQPRSMAYESPQIPYQTVPQVSDSAAAIQRWYEDSSVNRSLETSSLQPFSWNKQGSWSRSDDDSGSLRGILSQLDRRKNGRLQPKMREYGRHGTYSSPLLSATKSHRCQAVYGTDLEPDNEDWDKSFLTQNRINQPSQKIILDLSPIDKSSPRKTAGQNCKCCRRRMMTNRGSQTCSPAPQAKRPLRVNARVQTDNLLNLVDKKCQTSIQEKNKSIHLNETDPSLFNSYEHSNNSNNNEMGQCSSFVASEPGENLLGQLLIGVEREP